MDKSTLYRLSNLDLYKIIVEKNKIYREDMETLKKYDNEMREYEDRSIFKMTQPKPIVPTFRISAINEIFSKFDKGNWLERRSYNTNYSMWQIFNKIQCQELFEGLEYINKFLVDVEDMAKVPKSLLLDCLGFDYFSEELIEEIIKNSGVNVMQDLLGGKDGMFIKEESGSLFAICVNTKYDIDEATKIANRLLEEFNRNDDDDDDFIKCDNINCVSKQPLWIDNEDGSYLVRPYWFNTTGAHTEELWVFEEEFQDEEDEL